jgi:tetratricopeptide (TPR) repeat protein
MRWVALLTTVAAFGGELEKARDAQDRAGLERQIKSLSDAAGKNGKDANAQYQVALANSYLAEIAIEQRDKGLAKNAAVTGMDAAKKALAINGGSAEYHRILGTLCGQVIPANVLLGMQYGKCALEEVNKSIEMDSKNPLGYLSRGVGNYYLPPQFGGGTDKAIADFQKAIQMDPKLAEAHLWLGVALRKANKNGDARKAFEQSLKLNPNRVWAKQQLEKTPAQ